MINYNLNLNKHVKPQNKIEFGYFLAGLVDADGHIAKHGHLQISFHMRDFSVALYIHKLIKHGYIYKHKKVKACCYICSKHAGIEEIYKLLVHKLRLPGKIDQFNTRLVARIKKNWSGYGLCWNNHWFAGFVQGDGSFQIKIRKPHNPLGNHQIEVVLQFEQKQLCILKQIQAEFGGNVSYRAKRNTYTYSSVNINNALKLVQYFDTYQVNGSSYRIYLIGKEVLKLVLNKEHLNNIGFSKIVCLKQAMTNLKIKV